MLLQYIKKLTPETMASLQLAKARAEKLAEIDDTAFLCKDLAVYKNLKPLKGNASHIKTQIVKTLSSFEEPAEEFVIDLDVVPKNNIFYRKTIKKEIEKPSFFICGEQYGQLPGITITISKENQENLFCLGPFQASEKNFIFSREPNILEIASYFYNRQPLYRQVHDLLSFNQTTYKEVLGEAFTEDLLALFSVEEAVKEKSIIKLPHTNLKKELKTYWGKDTKTKKLLSFLYFGLENHKKRGISGHYDTGNIQIDIFLRGKEKLVIDAFLLFPLEDFEQTLTRAARDRIFNFIVNFQIEAWLQQYVVMINFGMKILEKVKTKMLLENI